MGQENKTERRDRMRGVGMAGSQSRSQSGSETVRARRAAQREGQFTQRFDQEKFGLNGEGQVQLKLADVSGVAVTARDTIVWRAGATSPTANFDLGYVSGPKMDVQNDEIVGSWVIPPDCDRTKPVTLYVYLAQIGTTSAAFEIDLQVYAYEAADNVVTDDGSPTTTLNLDGTTTATSGDPHVFTNEITAALAFPTTSVVALLFRATSTVHSASDPVWHTGAIGYTRTLTPATHKHE